MHGSPPTLTMKRYRGGGGGGHSSAASLRTAAILQTAHQEQAQKQGAKG